MSHHVVSPDGTRWIVRRVTAPWRLRHRVGFAGDPIGILLWLGAWLLLLAEAVVWVVAWVVRTLRLTAGMPWIVEARTLGRPERVLRWRVSGATASRERVGEIAAALAAGHDVAATADEREVRA